jgi:hypothetical protein
MNKWSKWNRFFIWFSEIWPKASRQSCYSNRPISCKPLRRTSRWSCLSPRHSASRLGKMIFNWLFYYTIHNHIEYFRPSIFEIFIDCNKAKKSFNRFVSKLYGVHHLIIHLFEFADSHHVQIFICSNAMIYLSYTCNFSNFNTFSY